MLRSILPALLIVACPALVEAQAVTGPQAPAATPPEPAPEATWALGGGFGMALLSYPATPFFTFSNVFDGQTASGVSLNTPPFAQAANSPAASLLLEHRLSPGVWLIGRAVISYASTSSTDALTGSSTSTISAAETDASLSIGLRLAFLTTSRVQISALLLGGAGYTSLHVSASQGGSNPASEEDWTGYVVAVSAGLACDAFLTSNLAVRVSTPLLALSYDSGKGTTTTVGSPPSENTGISDVSGGLVLAPSIELRVLF